MNWDAIGAVFTGLSGVSAALATYFAFRAVRVARQQSTVVEDQLALDRRFRRMDVHARLISAGRSIQEGLPSEVNDLDWEPGADERRKLVMFWYHVFDEWTVCNRENTELTDLWEGYYQHGVASALRLPAFRRALKEMVDTSRMFGLATDFKEELERISLASVGVGVDDPLPDVALRGPSLTTST